MHNWKRRSAPLAIGLILLTGCAGGTSSPSVCPPIREYSSEFQARVIVELDLLPKEGAIETQLLDYAALRDQIRPCRP